MAMPKTFGSSRRMLTCAAVVIAAVVGLVLLQLGEGGDPGIPSGEPATTATLPMESARPEEGATQPPNVETRPFTEGVPRALALRRLRGRAILDGIGLKLGGLGVVPVPEGSVLRFTAHDRIWTATPTARDGGFEVEVASDARSFTISLEGFHLVELPLDDSGSQTTRDLGELRFRGGAVASIRVLGVPPRDSPWIRVYARTAQAKGHLASNYVGNSSLEFPHGERPTLLSVRADTPVDVALTSLFALDGQEWPPAIRVTIPFGETRDVSFDLAAGIVLSGQVESPMLAGFSSSKVVVEFASPEGAFERTGNFSATALSEAGEFRFSGLTPARVRLRLTTIKGFVPLADCIDNTEVWDLSSHLDLRVQPTESFVWAHLVSPADPYTPLSDNFRLSVDGFGELNPKAQAKDRVLVPEEWIKQPQWYVDSASHGRFLAVPEPCSHQTDCWRIKVPAGRARLDVRWTAHPNIPVVPVLFPTQKAWPTARSLLNSGATRPTETSGGSFLFADIAPGEYALGGIDPTPGSQWFGLLQDRVVLRAQDTAVVHVAPPQLERGTLVIADWETLRKELRPHLIKIHEIAWPVTGTGSVDFVYQPPLQADASGLRLGTEPRAGMLEPTASGRFIWRPLP